MVGNIAGGGERGGCAGAAIYTPTLGVLFCVVGISAGHAGTLVHTVLARWACVVNNLEEHAWVSTESWEAMDSMQCIR